MLPEEQRAVTVFLSAVAAVYVFAAGMVIRSIVGRLRKTNRPLSKFDTWFRRIIFCLAITGVLCVAYGYFIEPYRLTIRKIEIRSGKLPANERPIRIVHISDLHSDPVARLEEKLPEAIAAQNPDIIVFTGDSVNSPAGLPVFRNCLSRISRIAPTYVVKGNWDVWYWSDQDLFGNLDVKELAATTEKVLVRGTEIWLAGTPVGKEGKIGKILESLPKDKFSIFLFHYPDEIEDVAQHGTDLYCAGHTHGGQIALPFYGALMTLSKYGKRFEGGTYRVENTWLNVNRGIGMEGGEAPRVRFWATPEITVIDVIPN